jgi:tetratricopeptide (TPR) repeat protein
MDHDHNSEEEVQIKFADRFKEQGNTAFQRGEFAAAHLHYTKAIKCTPKNAILYSNRAACLLKLKRFEEARDDAAACIELDADFLKGHLRLGSSLLHLGKYKKAIQAFKRGIECTQRLGNMTDDTLFQDGISECNKYLREMGPTKVDITDELPNEVCDLIMQFLDPSSLMQCESTCTKLRQLARQTYLWKNHCHRRWTGKIENEYTALFHGAAIEKHWKLYYYEAERYYKRDKISEDDLCNSKWTFNSHFNNGGGDVDPVFHRDRSYTSQITARGMKWRILDEGSMVQVHQFPPLSVSRMPNGGWQMINEYVILASTGNLFK